MTTTDQLVAADRRRVILAALQLAPRYTLARALLREQLDNIGYPVSADRLATDAAWLSEQGLVLVEPSGALRLTERGQDVVLDRAQVPGVQRPAA